MLIVGRGRRRRRHRISHTIIGDRHSSRSNRDIGNMAKFATFKRHNSNHFKYWTVIASSALILFMTMETKSSELHPAWRSSSGTLRNIRHLPCVSRRTGETGLCMFAYSCAKANGTHLGTCIDRFYFGSCCKINANSDPDLVDPIVHNYLNKDEMSSSSMKTPYQRPSSGIPDFSVDTSSTMSLPVSVSSVSRPSSVSMPSSSSAADLFSTMFGGKKPASSVHTTSSIAYTDTIPITSRTPLVNVTFSQSYSTPTTHVTTSPLLYTTSMSTVFQTGTHKPLPAFQTTSYSKPITASKPTAKPGGKPKPSQGPAKPKPTKPPTKPSSIAQSSFATSLYSSTESSFGSASFLNKTTIYSSNNGFPSKPVYTTESNTVPTKTTSRPSSQGIPTPITLFTSSSKKPVKPTKPPAVYTTSLPPTTYIKVPVSTLSQSDRTQTTMSSSSFPSSSSSATHFSTTYGPTLNASVEEIHTKFNNSIDDNEISEKPPKPWTSSSSSSMFSTRPWMTQSSSSSTPSQPALVTWTTIDEVPMPAEIIPPDRTKPTSILKPSGKPPTTKPGIVPTSTKPFASSTSRPPLMKPTTTSKPDTEENYRPPIMMTSSSTTSTTSSPGWVEVPITTHPAPTILSHTSSMPTTDVDEGMTIISHSKPSTSSVTIPVASPLPIDTTPEPPLESNEIPGMNMSDYRAVCGRRMFPTARIVGGEKATFGKWPWQISLRQWRTSTYLHKCGAALFNENWAVTAAHCVENVPPGDLLLRLGEHDLSIEDEPYGYQERRVQIVASHPQFDPRTFEYDLALLRFYEPVKFQPNIIPICVPEDDTNFVGTQAFVTGWGRLYEDGPLPSILQEVSVPVINNSLCENMYQAAGYIEHIPNIFICAGWKKGGFDSCEGDSGGPMVIQRPDKRWLLAGIISWGIGCAEPNQPGVYTRISEFRDWINQILQF